MADFNGANYQAAFVDEVKSQIDAKNLSGKLRRIYDSFTLSAELLITETISAGKLPPGAKLVDARFVAPSDGTSGQYDMGWLSNGVDAADDDGIFDGATECDTGAGAVDAKMKGVSAGWNFQFADVETEIVITVLEATTASVGDVLEWELIYAVE